MSELGKEGTKLSDLATGSFGCCHAWNQCNMGADGCIFEQADPEFAHACSCYKRHASKRSEIKNEPTIFFDANGQGVLF